MDSLSKMLLGCHEVLKKREMAILTSVDQYWSKVCGVIFDIFKLIIFKNFYDNVSLAQLVESWTGDLKVPDSNPGLEFFFLLNSF